MNKLIVFGMDGATWNIVLPLIKDGKLPTLKNLVENSISGNLESSIPTGTFPAWKCYSTGKNPGKLGVYSFLKVDTKNKKVTANDSNSFDGRNIWDYLGRYGYSAGIINMPGTYPPNKINGFMVGHSVVEVKEYTYPQNIENEIKDKFGYSITPKYLYLDNKDKCIDEIIKLIKNRVKVAKYLNDKYNPLFFHLTFFYTDHVQHYYWKYMDSKDPIYGDAIERIWIEIDKGIKELIEYFSIKYGKDIYIILMSDHGFQKVKGEFALGKWLIDQGYMKLNHKAFLLDKISTLGINKDSLIYLLNKLRLMEILKKIIPQSIQFQIFSYLPGKKGITSMSGDKLLDWNKSKIIQMQGLYINKNVIEEKQYEKLRNEFINKLSKIKNDITGESLYTKIYKKEQILIGPYLENAPDIIGVTEGYTTPPQYDSKSYWSVSGEETWSGYHDLHGIFLAHGPGIKKGQKIENAKIFDLAPTILHIFGLPIPNDMDGRVLTEIFGEDSELAKRLPKYVDPSYYDSDKRIQISNKINKLKKSGKF